VESPLTSPLVERRRAGRRQTVREHGIESARVRRGVHVLVIDVSAGGVLIETRHRLLPGMPLEIHLERNEGAFTMRGRVLRCGVVRLTASSVCYRGAIRFDGYLPWLTDGVATSSSFTTTEGQ
jgi:PilZ domain-containing protein